MSQCHRTLAAGQSACVSRRFERPNILFIWTDQQTAAAMSNAGNPWLRTPALDSLARDGVTFERAYCSDPICVPSRTSWITGRMPHDTTVTYNTGKHPVGADPMSCAFGKHGYDTGYVGKWHIPHDPQDRNWHGFDYVRHARSGDRIDPDVFPACDEFLRSKRDRPFFLVASFVNPHDICEWARNAAGMPTGLPNGGLGPAPPVEECPTLPTNFAIPLGEPEVIRRLKSLAPGVYPTSGWSEEAWRRYLWAYYRLVERVDAQIGKILQSVRETGQDEDTVIVFSSDHGDGAGAHAWNPKTVFYDEVARIPFIVRPPLCARSGVRDVANLVSFNLDFFPTAYDYAGIPLPEALEGRSVRGLVEGRPGATGHRFLVSQSDLAPEYGKSGSVFGRMLRSKRYKYVLYSEGAKREQLFDMDSDPGEMRDLALEPGFADVLADHQDLLDDWMVRHSDEFTR